VECTRGAGEKVRELMEEAIIRNNQTVVLDFDGITGITQSFVDFSTRLKSWDSQAKSFCESFFKIWSKNIFSFSIFI
jgi:hypothetical protein